MKNRSGSRKDSLGPGRERAARPAVGVGRGFYLLVSVLAHAPSGFTVLPLYKHQACETGWEHFFFSGVR